MNEIHRSHEHELEKKLLAVPILSLHSPFGWEFDCLGVVTSQSVTGTGVLSEITSTVTDIFGLQSGTFKKKLKSGENICMKSLRLDALAMGGNAIIGTDIDYAEVGGVKGMLMVCMTGTAIRLRNLDVLGSDVVDKITRAKEILTDLLSRPCSACGAIVTPEDRYCRVCHPDGAALSEDQLMAEYGIRDMGGYYTWGTQNYGFPTIEAAIEFIDSLPPERRAKGH